MKYRLAKLSALAALALLSACRTPGSGSTESGAPVYRNLGSDATYVGKEVCRGCHATQYDTFIKAEMGRSFAKATLANSAADFENAKPVYDRFADLTYLPFAVGDSMYLMEYRVVGRDTVHKRIEKIDYIVGSGQHTNSHIMEENGYLYQVPLTWYAQDRRWDLPPGFAGGNNSRFSRPIPLQCMTCHNGFPKFVEGSENRYTKVQEGIDCERCHGPGSIHVAEIAAGRIVNTADSIDYSIVNPAKLPIDRQFDICQDCHMQGVTVYKEGKTPFDFRPGRTLSDVQNTFWPRYADSVQAFKMASHPDRLKMSSCFQASHANPDDYQPLTCITCHNPHVGVKEITTATYNAACESCHSEKIQAASPTQTVDPTGSSDQSGALASANDSTSRQHAPTVKQTLCTETESARAAVGDNCISCHMPTSGSSDIPHIKITDHYIRRPDKGEHAVVRPNDLGRHGQFYGLAGLIDDSPSASDLAEGFLAYYEQVTNNPAFLDSAIVFIEKAQADHSQSDQSDAGRSTVELARLWIWAWYWKQDYQAIANLAPTLDEQSVADAWTWFRIGKAFDSLGRTAEAVHYLELAIDRSPQQLRFMNELAAAYEHNGQPNEAVATYNYILEQNPKFEIAYNDRGYTWLVLGDFQKAESDFVVALDLDPNGAMPLANLASLYYNTGRADEARPLVRRLLAMDPGNPDYLRLWNALPSE